MSINNREEAIKATDEFIHKSNNSKRKQYEYLRHIIDDEKIIEAIGAKSEGAYIEEYFKSHFEVNSVRNNLNCARLIHIFNENNIDIPVSVNFTAIRALVGSFKEYDYDEDRRLDYKLRAWKVASELNEIPNEQDINQAIEEVQLDIATREDLLNELNRLKTENTDNMKITKAHFSNFPKDIKHVFMKKINYRNIDNKYLSECINIFDSMIGDDKSLKENRTLVTECFEAMKLILSALGAYETDDDDNDKLKAIVNDIYYFASRYRRVLDNEARIVKVQQRIDALDQTE